MTKNTFKTEMRLGRGRLSRKSTDDALDYLYNNATNNFMYFMLTTKKLGVEKAANIVSELDEKEQDKLISWIETQPKNIPVEAVELKILKIIEDR